MIKLCFTIISFKFLAFSLKLEMHVYVAIAVISWISFSEIFQNFHRARDHESGGIHEKRRVCTGSCFAIFAIFLLFRLRKNWSDRFL